MAEALGDALAMLVEPQRLSLMAIGVLVGLTMGVLPGLGGVVGMSLLLPFIFGMDPFSGMALLIGMIAVGHTSDTFPSVLLGIPGSAGSQATIMDGYPMARKGQAARALGASFSASMIGGLFGAIFLLAALFAARPLVLALGSPELLMLSILGLSMVGILARGAPIPGLLAAIIGLLLGSVGGAVAVPTYRFAAGEIYLYDGIPLAALALGLFAVPELVSLLAENRSVSKSGTVEKGLLAGVRETLSHKFLVFRSSLMGMFIGMIPGLGGSVVDWLAYGIAQRTSRDSETFGTGDIRGIIAPESANNAKEGGTMVPTLLFGIPGSGTTAILLGGLMLMGIQPGPAMLDNNLEITVLVIWSLALANVLAAGLCLALSSQISKISLVPSKILAPFMFIIIVVGAYQSSRHWGDILVLLGVGIMGLLMKEAGWPRAPVLIGFVLAGNVERYLHLSIQRYDYDWLRFPTVITIAIVTVVLLAFGTLYSTKRDGGGPRVEDSNHTVDDEAGAAGTPRPGGGEA